MTERPQGLVRRWLPPLLHIDDTPERTAGAYALGVFLAFSPFLGLHTLLGIALAFALRLNRVAVILGVYSNLPWILAPYYAFATIAGAALTRSSLPPAFRSRLAAMFESSIFEPAFWHSWRSLFGPLLVPFVVGSLVGATVLAALAYRLALVFLALRRR